MHRLSTSAWIQGGDGTPQPTDSDAGDDRCHEFVTSSDNPLRGPFESLDAMRNDATIVGVIGWSSQL